MPGTDLPWIDAFLNHAPPRVEDDQVAKASSPALDVPSRDPEVATDAGGFTGSDLIGIGYLTGPEPAEVLEQVTAAFGVVPALPPAAALTLWR